MQKWLPKAGFKRNLAVMISGTTMAQVVSFAAAPLLTRLYAPEDFGVYAMFNVFASIIGMFVSLRYEGAIVLPKDEKSAFGVLCLTLFINFLLSVLCWPALGLFFMVAGGHWFKDMSLSLLLPFLAFNIALNGLTLILVQWFNRQENYRALAYRTIFERVANVTLSFALVLYFKSFWGLILAQIFGQLFSNLFLLVKLIPAFKKHPVPTGREMKDLAREYKDFPLHSGWASVCMVSAWQLPQLFIGSFYSVATAGQFNLAIRLLEAPLTLFGNTFSTLYFRKMATVAPERWRELIKRSLKPMFLFPLVPTLVMVALGPAIFSLVFGARWREAGEFASVLVVLYWFRLIYVSQTPMFAIFRRLDMDLKLSFALLVSQLCALALGQYLFADLKGVTLLMTGLSSMVFIYGCVWVWQQALRSEKLFKAGG